MPTRIDNRSAPIDAPFTPSAGGVDIESFKAGMQPLTRMPALDDARWNGRNAGGEVRSVPMSNIVPGKAPAR
jgi:hypothetical protein